MRKQREKRVKIMRPRGEKDGADWTEENDRNKIEKCRWNDK